MSDFAVSSGLQNFTKNFLKDSADAFQAWSQWSRKNEKLLINLNGERVNKSTELQNQYINSPEFMEKRTNKARNKAYSVASSVEPYVDKTGDVKTTALQNKFGKNTPEYSKALQAATKLAEINKASFLAQNTAGGDVATVQYFNNFTYGRILKARNLPTR